MPIRYHYSAHLGSEWELVSLAIPNKSADEGFVRAGVAGFRRRQNGAGGYFLGNPFSSILSQAQRMPRVTRSRKTGSLMVLLLWARVVPKTRPLP